MNNRNTLAFQLDDIKSALENGRIVEFETHGFSMVPLLHDGGDRVMLKKAESDLAVNDVALCSTDDGRFVLHRVIDNKNGYTLMGDNCVTKEHCSGNDDVIGVAVGFIRRGKTIAVTDRKYLFYVRYRVLFLKLWRAFWKVSDFFVKILRK